MLMRHHEEAFRDSAQHHAAPPIVHHYVSVEHKGLHTPLHHFSTPVPSVPVHVEPTLPVHKHISPLDRIKMAVGRVRHLGKKSAGAVAETGKTVNEGRVKLKHSPKAAALANTYNALDEAQKGITNRHFK